MQKSSFFLSWITQKQTKITVYGPKENWQSSVNGRLKQVLPSYRRQSVYLCDYFLCGFQPISAWKTDVKTNMMILMMTGFYDRLRLALYELKAQNFYPIDWAKF